MAKDMSQEAKGPEIKLQYTIDIFIFANLILSTKT